MFGFIYGLYDVTILLRHQHHVPRGEPLDCLPHFVAQWLPKLCAEAHCSGHDGSKEGLGESTTGACKGGGERQLGGENSGEGLGETEGA